MSASERLREMQKRGVRFVVEGTWEDALPEIIAVVEAADTATAVEHFYPTTYDALVHALAALDEKLAVT